MNSNRRRSLSSRNRLTQSVLYTSESQLRRPGLLWHSMVQDLLASRELAWRLLVRDISAKYRQSALGIFWAIIPPVVTAAGFAFAKGSGIINIGATDLPYPAYVMFSMSLWQTFVEALNAPLQAVVGAKAMMARVNFPREALVLAKLGEVCFGFAIKLVLIIGLFLWFRIPVTWAVLLTPVALIHLILFGTMIGLFLAPIGALYSDLLMGITLLTSVWFFLTPVVYPVPTDSIFGAIVKFNPVTPLILTLRELATTGVITNASGFWVVSVLTLFGLLVAWLFYRLAMPYVVERISS
jgi:lipopolysaccharide transport system permease protein